MRVETAGTPIVGLGCCQGEGNGTPFLGRGHVEPDWLHGLETDPDAFRRPVRGFHVNVREPVFGQHVRDPDPERVVGRQIRAFIGNRERGRLEPHVLARIGVEAAVRVGIRHVDAELQFLGIDGRDQNRVPPARDRARSCAGWIACRAWRDSRPRAGRGSHPPCQKASRPSRSPFLTWKGRNRPYRSYSAGPRGRTPARVPRTR